MRIVVDVCGADLGYQEVIKGALMPLEAGKDFTLVLSGPEEEIRRRIDPRDVDKYGIEFLNAEEVITNDEEPVAAIRNKKFSSMVVALRALRAGEVDGVLSTGSTGALLAGATLIIGRIKNIDRAALTILVPGISGPTVFLDVGANMDCSPKQLVQFARMGTSYAKFLFGKEEPSVGLLNIGSEETKGNKLTLETYRELNMSDLNFVGNVEPNDILDNDFDVVVCDGFSGNLVLKTIEGVADSIGLVLKESIKANPLTSLGGFLAKPAFRNLKKILNSDEVGAAPMLGAKKPVFKAHGSSDRYAIAKGIVNLIDFIQAGVIEEITKTVEEETY